MAYRIASRDKEGRKKESEQGIPGNGEKLLASPKRRKLEIRSRSQIVHDRARGAEKSKPL